MSLIVKILLIEDHEIIRDGLKYMIAGKISNSHYSFFETESIAGAKVLIEEKRPDLILVDFRLKDGTGDMILSWMKNSNISIPTIAISNYSEKSYISKMISCGANGYLLKDVDRELLATAIETVLSGGSFFLFDQPTPVLKQSIPEYIINQYHITKREQEILYLMVEQLTPKQISEKLFISYRTVETHRQNLFNKFHVNSTMALVRALLANSI